MRYDPDVSTTIVLAVCCLHNWLRSDVVGRSMNTPPNFVDSEGVYAGRVNMGEWHDGNNAGLARLVHQGGNRHAESALDLRNRWCEYFNGPGAVPWQDRMMSVSSLNYPIME
ncbi:Chemotaxis protein CheA [Frankliniella fusca]|uniref:Chemotaxis protein CheA n=1 Tax=Frankliniella fusca TaxID=407009 RepID=A0AAE1HWD6_9NEOP|nr:Chemotaxis protein CheA [Frankliniella fusca]